LGPNILLSTLFSNTLSLCSSLSVRDQHNQFYYINMQLHVSIITWSSSGRLNA
jgi:hypothetical protein